MGLELRLLTPVPSLICVGGMSEQSGEQLSLSCTETLLRVSSSIPATLTIHGPVHSELPAGGEIDQPQSFISEGDRKECFPHSSPPPPAPTYRFSPPGAPGGLETSRPTTLTAQQAPVRRILSTRDLTLHSEVPARSESCLFPS